MSDILTRLDRLHRPQLLVEAARSGLRLYVRETHLGRALGRALRAGAIAPAPALAELLDIEDELDHQRRARDAAYSYLRHVEVLIALMAEARIVRPAEAQAPAE
ncbi:hypothetical protein DZK27_07125 [Rhodobacteraceae bacterium 63075]|nr:hypothetical protein DZK27_07125 [Rhodobacteraceae bacterium 63075]